MYLKVKDKKPLFHSNNVKRMHSDKILRNVQATIFEPHKREFVRYLFFRFPEDKRIQIKNGIIHLAESGRITRGLDQWEENIKYIETLEKYKEKKSKARKEAKKKAKGLLKPIYCLFLTHQGCSKLKPIEAKDFPENNTFRDGMHGELYRGIIFDPPKEQWQTNSWYKAYYEGGVDMMLMIAHNQEDGIKEEQEEITKQFVEGYGAEFLHCEKGEKIFAPHDDPETDKPREIFGFRDGLSRIPFWYSYRKRKLSVFQRDIVLDKHLGSYLIFRKLEQHESLFKKKIEVLTSKLFDRKDFSEAEWEGKKAFVEAQIIGRFKDGTPLELYGEPMIDNGKATAEDLQKINDYNEYNVRKEIANQQKNSGPNQERTSKCPFFAHTLKINPRNPETILLKQARYKSQRPFLGRIARRGITYRYFAKDGSVKSEGLLFMGYQAEPLAQFFTLKREWLNKVDFFNFNTGIDPIIGRNGKQADWEGYPYKWLVNWDTGETKEVKMNFLDIITFLGGDYFYTPSIPWLLSLKDHTEKAYT